jgi:hypothetical protein
MEPPILAVDHQSVASSYTADLHILVRDVNTEHFFFPAWLGRIHYLWIYH